MVATGAQDWVITGPQTLPYATAAHAAALARLEAGPLAVIDCAGVTEADLSFVQLLLAIRTSVLGLGVLDGGETLALIHPQNGPLERVLRRGGFLHADAAPELLAFWRSGVVAA